MKKVLLICAHPDDEAYGLGATLHYMTYNKKWDVTLLTFTDGVNCKKDDADTILHQLKTSCRILGIKDHIEFCLKDQELETYPLGELVAGIQYEVNRLRPELVLTHNSTDLNLDHRVLFEATMVACRPKSDCSIKKVWTYEIPSSTNWGFGEFGSFEPNIFIPTTVRGLTVKTNAIRCYTNELEKPPNARSIEAVQTLCKYRGNTIGVHYAEAFKLIRGII